MNIIIEFGALRMLGEKNSLFADAKFFSVKKKKTDRQK
jgi:hypothetical protein